MGTEITKVGATPGGRSYKATRHISGKKGKSGAIDTDVSSWDGKENWNRSYDPKKKGRTTVTRTFHNGKDGFANKGPKKKA